MTVVSHTIRSSSFARSCSSGSYAMPSPFAVAPRPTLDRLTRRFRATATTVTVEDTAEQVTERGGCGSALAVNHAAQHDRDDLDQPVGPGALMPNTAARGPKFGSSEVPPSAKPSSALGPIGK